MSTNNAPERIEIPNGCYWENWCIRYPNGKVITTCDIDEVIEIAAAGER